ncbi:hypothetical protein [Microvirga alba]|nr:hypothetical protein [Microvirga alba]
MTTIATTSPVNTHSDGKPLFIEAGMTRSDEFRTPPIDPAMKKAP